MNDVTLAIFAGGRGSRMGVTKDRLAIGGKPILVHLLERLQFVGPTLLVAAPDHPRPVGADRFDRVVTDDKEHAGPLLALSTLFQAIQTPLFVTLSVDMPGVGSAQIEWLIEQLATKPSARGLFCTRTVDAALQIEPFPAVYRQSAGRAVADHVAVGHTSLRSILINESFVTVEAPETWPGSVWLNLNRREDLQQIAAEFL